MQKIWKIFLLFICISLLLNSYDLRRKDNLFSKIQSTYINEDWLSAEKLLNEYLATETNPDRCWVAWYKLIDISERMRIDNNIILNYLNNMYNDYASYKDKKKFILYKIANIKENKSIIEAIEAWEDYLFKNKLSQDELFVVYKKLSKLYYRAENYDSLEEILENCLSLDVIDPKLIFCKLNLAEFYSVKTEFDMA